MMLFSMKLIQKLLFMSGSWHGVIDSNKVKHSKRYKQSINASSMAFIQDGGWCMPEDRKNIKLGNGKELTKLGQGSRKYWQKW